MRLTTLSLLLLAGLPGVLRADEPAAARPLPDRVDLRPRFEVWKLSVRSQGRRNTCSVFVTTGALEFAASQHHQRATRLSVEYLNWACNREIGNTRADRGQFFHDLLKGLDSYGICREEQMPYEPRFRNSQPSTAARESAEGFRKPGFQVHWIRPWSKEAGLTDMQFQATKETLAAGWPVCAGSDHSRLLVGYADDPQQSGGGTFLTRDSGLGRDDAVTYDWARKHVYDLFWVEMADPKAGR